jgi:hypothetical protein
MYGQLPGRIPQNVLSRDRTDGLLARLCSRYLLISGQIFGLYVLQIIRAPAFGGAVYVWRLI